MELVLSLLDDKVGVLVPVTSVKLDLKVAESIRDHAMYDPHPGEPADRRASARGKGCLLVSFGAAVSAKVLY